MLKTNEKIFVLSFFVFVLFGLFFLFWSLTKIFFVEEKPDFFSKNRLETVRRASTLVLWWFSSFLLNGTRLFLACRCSLFVNNCDVVQNINALIKSMSHEYFLVFLQKRNQFETRSMSRRKENCQFLLFFLSFDRFLRLSMSLISRRKRNSGRVTSSRKRKHFCDSRWRKNFYKRQNENVLFFLLFLLVFDCLTELWINHSSTPKTKTRRCAFDNSL